MGKRHEAKAQREARVRAQRGAARGDGETPVGCCSWHLGGNGSTDVVWLVKSYRDELGRMAAAAFAYAAECMVRRAPAPQAAKVTVEVYRQHN